MKRLLLLLLLPGAMVTYGQELKQTIKGTVVDKQSEFEMPGAKVTVISVTPVLNAMSDINGKFRIPDVPVGRHTIEVSMIGYETVTLSNLVLNSGKELDLHVELEESIEDLGEVVVTAQDDKREALNQMSTVSARTFSIEEANRYSGTFQDPARMVQNYAGVSGANDDRNDIIIRGNSPTGVLWRLEGIDIPSPNHFSTIGTTGGPISMLNINNLSNSDFMTSAFSADYGNALAGVFDLKLRNGNADKREYIGQVGFNGFEFGAEGPFKKGKQASYVVNYRYSFLDILLKMGLDLGTGASVPEYQDINFKINLPTKNAGRFAIFGLGGLSHIEFLAEDVGDQNLFAGENEDSRFNSNSGVFGISHTYFYNSTTFSKLVIAASAVQTTGTIDSVSLIDESRHKSWGMDRRQYKYSFNFKVNKKFSAKNTGRIGVMGDYYDLDMKDSSRYGTGFSYNTDFTGGAMLLQGYALWQHKFNDKITMNSGLHSQHFMYSNSHSVEPRWGMKFQPNPRHTFSLGAGLHSQLQPLTVYFVNEDVSGESTLPNKDIDFTRSFHAVVGHDFFLGEDIRLKTELYYQHLFNVPVDTFSSSFSMLNEGADFTIANQTGLINNGTGSNMGVELTLEKFFSKGYYFLTTLSIFDSRYKGSDDIERNTIFNGNYVANLLGGKEFKIGKKFLLSFDTKVTYAGGRRYTPIDLDASMAAGYEVRDWNQAFEEKYNDYFRLDFKTTFRYNGKKAAQMLAFDIQNVTNQQNVFQHGYNRFTEQVVTTYQRGFFPIVLYRILF